MDVYAFLFVYITSGFKLYPDFRFAAWSAMASHGQLSNCASPLFYVRRRDVLIHGYTRNCGRCNAISAGRSWTNAHSTACRRRFAKLLPDRFCIGEHSQCNDPPPEVVLTLAPGESCKRMRLSLSVWVTVEMDLGEQKANIERAGLR